MRVFNISSSLCDVYRQLRNEKSPKYMNRINSGSLFIYIKCLDIWPFRYEELYMFQFTHKIQQTVVSDSFLLQSVPFLGMVLDNAHGFHGGNSGHESTRKITGWVAVSQSCFKLHRPTGVSERDDTQAVPPVRITFFLQHILNTNQFFSALFTVFAGIFPGGGS